MQFTSWSEFAGGIRTHDAASLTYLRNVAAPILKSLSDQVNYAGVKNRFVERGIVFARLYLAALETGVLERLGAFSDRMLASFLNVVFRRYFVRTPPDWLAGQFEIPLQREVDSLTALLLRRYRVRREFHPHDDVGGDFAEFGVHDGRAWMIVGDVSGDGWLAHLVAEGCRLLVSRIVRETVPAPQSLLATLHSQLRPVLPSGLFVEMSIAVGDDKGSVEIGFGGATWLARWHTVARQISAERPGGSLVGLDADIPADNRRCIPWRMVPGDEAVLGSDGLFDQPLEAGVTLGRWLEACTDEGLADGETFHDTIWSRFAAAVQTQGQFDDMTQLSFKLQPPTCDDCPDDACPDLAERCLSKHPTAEESLYRVLCSRTRPTVERSLREVPEIDADDVLQDAMLRLFRNLHQWRRDCPLCLFFRVIAVREALRQRHWIKRHGTRPWPDGFDWPAPSVDPSSEMAECIEAKANTFRPQWQDVLRQKLDGKKHEEIARSLGIKSRTTIQNWLKEMREILLDCLEEK